MAAHNWMDNPDLVNVVTTFMVKREAENNLRVARDNWIDAMLAAREAGVSVADISRATGVTSPNVTNTIRAAKERRAREADSA